MGLFQGGFPEHERLWGAPARLDKVLGQNTDHNRKLNPGLNWG